MIQISSGYDHSLFLSNTSVVYSCGSGKYGQTGQNTVSNTLTPTLLPNFQVQIIQISAGGFHSLLLAFNGSIYSFGSNSVGQLGLGDFNNRLVPVLISQTLNIPATKISAGGTHSLYIGSNQRTYGFGNNTVRKKSHQGWGVGYWFGWILYSSCRREHYKSL